MRALVVALVLGLCLASPAAAKPPVAPAFDHYTLALSWVPSFCAGHSDPSECGRRKAFALHGLWPDGASARTDPQDCPGPALSAADRAAYQGIYASTTMIAHEWAKHGTCSGLSAADYFKLAVADQARLKIPAAYQTPGVLKASQAGAVTKAFLAANPGLPAGGLKVVTAGGLVSEVEACLAKDSSAFVACGR